MVIRLTRFIVAFALVFAFATQGFAQSGGYQGQSEEKSGISGPRKQLATIIFAGLGGAILGLSTLSFYGRPQDKLANIAIGFAVGVISGTTYVTYKAATNPQELYGHKPLLEPSENGRMLSSRSAPTPVGLNLQFEF